MSFYEIEFPLAALNLNEVEAALLDIGASSITFVDRGDEPVLEPKPGEFKLWSDTLVRALFEASDSIAREAVSNLVRLSVTLGAHVTQSARLRLVRTRVWERTWLEDWKSMRFGRRLWVIPTAADAPQDLGAAVVRLDPGLAFGTGTHPTTALCLQILDSLPLAGRSVIDYGCGSGILGLAALKLGAARVAAVDLDPQALAATRENAVRNGVSANITVQGVDSTLPASYCVLANILAAPLIELAPKLTAACETGGRIVLSGLLKAQTPAVNAAYAAGFDMVQVIERDEWCCIHARRVA
ncbi:MAG: 50S ribosomal protein L11 methyltransferase [Steroidobacteraceae bacterium]